MCGSSSVVLLLHALVLSRGTGLHVLQLLGGAAGWRSGPALPALLDVLLGGAWRGGTTHAMLFVGRRSVRPIEKK